jgi:hypothetical protein
VSSTRTRDNGEGVSEIASGSRLLKEDRFRAQAISQLLQATHRSELTKMDFITLLWVHVVSSGCPRALRLKGGPSCGNQRAQTVGSSLYQ